MLLTVTATSMAAAAVVAGCATTQPVGTVAQPPHDQVTDAATSPDVEQVPQVEEHTVGTVANPPDKK
jgi:hypothetical protein